MPPRVASGGTWPDQFRLGAPNGSASSAQIWSTAFAEW